MATTRTKLVARQNVKAISRQDWDALAHGSIFKNPFFAPACLLSALRHLDTEKTVYVVAHYLEQRLVCLFPIVIMRHKMGFKMVRIWNHNHCPLSDPLSIDNQQTSLAIESVLQQTGAMCFSAERHSPNSLGKASGQGCLIHQSYRGQISNFKSKSELFANMPPKVRSESKRIVRRINQELNLTYKTSQEMPQFDWFRAYCELEHSGWKSGAKGSILSQPNYLAYYKGFIDQSINTKELEFQGIFHNQKPVALAFRMISGNCAFDIKTSYDESHKKLYPGVVLEILNLIELAKLEFDFVDSCTQPNNRVINRLWPEQKIVHDSILFGKGFVASMLEKMMRWKRQK